MSAKNRLEHYPYTTERVTPVNEIPVKYQMTAPLPGGTTQIVDTRLCYNWQPGKNGGRWVECGSVAADAWKLYKESK